MASENPGRTQAAGLFGIGVGARVGVAAAAIVVLWAAVAWAVGA